MTLHLMKLCVGIEDVDHLIRVQQSRKSVGKKNGNSQGIRHITRNMPRRSEEILNGGSLYWVIRRVISVRQPIIGLESFEQEDGRLSCVILLANQYIRTVSRRSRPFQGWRYLSATDAPSDLANNEAKIIEELPPKMSAELRELGLL